MKFKTGETKLFFRDAHLGVKASVFSVPPYYHQPPSVLMRDKLSALLPHSPLSVLPPSQVPVLTLMLFFQPSSICCSCPQPLYLVAVPAGQSSKPPLFLIFGLTTVFEAREAVAFLLGE